jgi:hypothetical protein
LISIFSNIPNGAILSFNVSYHAPANSDAICEVGIIHLYTNFNINVDDSIHSERINGIIFAILILSFSLKSFSKSSTVLSLIHSSFIVFNNSSDFSGDKVSIDNFFSNSDFIDKNIFCFTDSTFSANSSLVNKRSFSSGLSV